METFIDIKEYTYDLPSERIAAYPLPQRDQSKLLVYDRGAITHHHFRSLAKFLSAKTTLVFNDTKVIPARLQFHKETGAAIEVFLLAPVGPSATVHENMNCIGPVQWQCSIGNLKRWNDGLVLTQHNESGSLEARLLTRDGIVEFVATPPRPFAETVRSFGETPLPPYIKRTAEPNDRERYQTIYSEAAGAVAAPTAGLHFTKEMIDQLQHLGIDTSFLTLHVSAGTFLPVKVQNATTHEMHREQLLIKAATIRQLLKPEQKIIAVGTTSLRTLESLYWFGVKLMEDPHPEFNVESLSPYQSRKTLPSRDDAIQRVLDFMEREKINVLTGQTAIYILPGYTFRVIDGLITNFHQPQSTLLLLIAALIGPDWKRVYDEALRNDYRFLSYGDSSLIFKS